MKRVLPWVWTGVVAVAMLVLIIVNWSQFEARFTSRLEQIFIFLFPVLYTALGTVILVRQPGNRIPWLFYVLGLWGVLDAAVADVIDEKPDPATAIDLFELMWSNVGWFVGLLIPLFLLLFLFPTGQFLSRRWSWGGWLAGVAWTSIIAAVLFSEEIGSTTTEEDWTVDNPIGFLPGAPFEGDSASGPLEVIFGLSLIGLLMGGVIAIVVRYRRSDLTVRTQIKWVMYSLMLFAVTIAFRLFWEKWASGLTTLALIAFLALIPIFITVAIVRYRLFEIDRLVSRTIGYAVVLVLLAGVYLVGAVWLPTQLLDQQPPIFVAGSTLAVVALFNPVRKRIIGWVDRRFYRATYLAEQVVDSFSDQVRDEIMIDRLTQNWVLAVSETLKPSAIGVWIAVEERGMTEQHPTM